MLILENKWGAPDAIVNAIKNDGYSATGDLSTTTLIAAPQPRLLRKHHDTTVDVRDRFYALWGSGVHAILEQSVKGLGGYLKMLHTASELDKGSEADKKVADWLRKRVVTMYPEVIEQGIIVERRNEIEVDGMIISGATDIYYTKLKKLQDYKTTTVWAFKNKDEKEDWDRQLNIYGRMWRNLGYECDTLEIVILMKDWNKNESIRDRNYPQSPYYTHTVPLWTDAEVDSYMKERVRIHRMAEEGTGIECTPKEMWRRPGSFAVKKEGGKRAISGGIFTDKKGADVFIENNTYKHGKMFVEERPGIDGKCESYCDVSSVCPQRKRNLELLNKINADEN